MKEPHLKLIESLKKLENCLERSSYILSHTSTASACFAQPECIQAPIPISQECSPNVSLRLSWEALSCRNEASVIYCTEEHTKQHRSVNYWLGRSATSPEFCCHLVRPLLPGLGVGGSFLHDYLSKPESRSRLLKKYQHYPVQPPSLAAAGQLSFNPIFFPVLSATQLAC